MFADALCLLAKQKNILLCTQWCTYTECRHCQEQFKNAASKKQGTFNARHRTHQLTVHVCRTFTVCLDAQSVKFLSILLFGECGCQKGGEKIVWLKGCIDRFESAGANICCVAEYYVGSQTQGRGCVGAVGLGFDVCCTLAKSEGIPVRTVCLPGAKADISLWLNHFAQRRVLEGTQKAPVKNVARPHMWPDTGKEKTQREYKWKKISDCVAWAESRQLPTHKCEMCTSGFMQCTSTRGRNLSKKNLVFSCVTVLILNMPLPTRQ